MFLKLPWLYKRRRLFLLTTIDSFTFIYFYFRYREIFEKRFSLFFFLVSIIILILVNYILGRYSDTNELNSVSRKDFFNSFFGFFLLLIIFSICFNLFLTKEFTSYILIQLVNLVFLQQSISFLMHLIVKSYFMKNIGVIKKWMVIGSESKFTNLLNEIKISDLKFDLELIEFENLMALKPNLSKNLGLIVLDPENLTRKDQELLVSIFGSNSHILDVLVWSEIYLQRFPLCFLAGSQIILKIFLRSTNNIQYRIKRTFDILIALLIIMITFPIVIISSILILIEDRGPIIYKQKRTGFNNKTFTIFKLRTMKINAENNGAQWSKKNDKRITFVGKFLRRTRIDELPQLLCVLNSDMSLIGPRPERPEIDIFLKKKIDNYDLRYKIKPGLSGWAQVNYPYGASIEDSQNKLSFDLYYIKNFNLFLDLLIFFKTIKLVFNASGAVAKN